MDADPDPAPARLSRALTRSFVLHVAARVVEALALGWLAAAIVLACDSLSGAPGLAAEAQLIAAIVGLLSAAATFVEHVPAPRAHARRVDERLGMDGALVTALDVRAEESSGLARALIRRVGARLGGFDLARASLPSTPLALVAIGLGLAVHFAARDLARPAGADFADPRSVAIGAEARETLTRVANTLQAAAARLQADGARAPASERRARDVAEVLEHAARRASLGHAARTDAERDLRALSTDPALTANEQHAARTALGSLAHPDGSLAKATAPPLPPTELAGAARSQNGDGNPASTPGTGHGDRLGESGVPGTLASLAAGGTMNGPEPSAAGSPSEPPAPGGNRERGVGSLRWWPARHDAVVEAWLATAQKPR